MTTPRRAILALAAFATFTLAGCTKPAATGTESPAPTGTPAASSANPTSAAATSAAATSASATKDAAGATACREARRFSGGGLMPPADYQKLVGDLAVKSSDSRLHEIGLKLQASAQAAVSAGPSDMQSRSDAEYWREQLQAACDSAGY